jgi:hypothetical protein
MMSPEEARRRAKELARAVAPVVGIALRCSEGDLVGLDRSSVKACLDEPIQYFARRNKAELVRCIESLVESLEDGGDSQARGAEVLACISRTYPS